VATAPATHPSGQAQIGIRASRPNDIWHIDTMLIRLPEMFAAHRYNPVQSTANANPYCERLIGSIRRDCLDHLIVLNEVHLLRILTRYFDYYHNSRPHLSLDRNSPTPRSVEPPSAGQVIAIPQVGGLHHRYTRRAA